MKKRKTGMVRTRRTKRARGTSSTIGLVAVWVLAAWSSGCQGPGGQTNAIQKATNDLPLMGHRNWIVIADSAYPWQSRSGIETLATSREQLATVKAVLAALDKARHVRPVVYLDRELPYVAEDDAPGVTSYRDALRKVLARRTVVSLPHEEIIAKLDKAGQTFRVLILKTNMTLPYTSVFIELDCGYWSPQAEQRLRDAIQAGGK